MSGAAQRSIALLLTLSLASLGLAARGAQIVLAPPHQVDAALLAALEKHNDSVNAYIDLQPEMADELAEPRLLHVFGEEPQWATEGEKLRLKRRGRRFADITDHQDLYSQYTASTNDAKANVPALSQQSLIRPLFEKISITSMCTVLEHLTSYYTRYFKSTTGAQSAMWLHAQVSDIIRTAPPHTHISLELFTHPFPQPSVIARFEPKTTNYSAPLTVLGAHVDSMNYLFPLLPAPGADDDASGCASILEAFRVLAQSGYVPLRGPVELHWYAGEEGGLLGSLPIAKYKQESGAKIGAMLAFDKTAYIAKNATPTIAFLAGTADPDLNKWLVGLTKEYIDVNTGIYPLPEDIGSDHMSFGAYGYPAAFTSEGDPNAGGFNPHKHGSEDRMDVDDENGVFSLEHMARFAELGIAFAVEQAGWDTAWR